MTLADTLGTAPGRWKVFASDIDTEVLEKARSGIYRHEELKNLAPQQLQRYFMRGRDRMKGWYACDRSWRTMLILPR